MDLLKRHIVDFFNTFLIPLVVSLLNEGKQRNEDVSMKSFETGSGSLFPGFII